MAIGHFYLSRAIDQALAMYAEGASVAHGYSKRLYMLVGPLATAPLRDGLYQRQRV